ncbi:MAG: cell division protein FtsQ/DivIB [Candidatus Omnitrophica bacterium]|nr:cell division protein FtsQ/DivIB [Candidatus Omnitrophota bacterium]
MKRTKKTKTRARRPRERRQVSVGPYVARLLQQTWSGIFAVMAVVLFGVYLYSAAREAPYFKVSSIIISEKNTDKTIELHGDIAEGECIFDVHLADVHRRIVQQFPEYKNIVVHRRLPHTIFVEATKRALFAQIKSGRYFPISREGLILPGASNLPLAGLPVIVDERRKIKDSQVGENIADDNIKAAFTLIEEIRGLDLPEEFEIYEIDVTDSRNIYLYQKGGIEIRVGFAPFTRKLQLLEETFKNFAIDSSKIKYIDLRFEDVVIGPK